MFSEEIVTMLYVFIGSSLRWLNRRMVGVYTMLEAGWHLQQPSSSSQSFVARR